MGEFDIRVELADLDNIYELEDIAQHKELGDVPDDGNTKVAPAPEPGRAPAAPADRKPMGMETTRCRWWPEFLRPPLFFESDKGVTGNIIFEMAAVYFFFFIIILSAELLRWTSEVRFYNLVPYFFLVYCVLELTRLLYLYAGHFSGFQVYLHLIPFGFLVIVVREAHQIVGLLFFAATMIIFLQIGDPKNQRVHLGIYVIANAVVYTAAVAFSQFFYVDSTGLASDRGRSLSRIIQWGEEGTFILANLLLGLAFIVEEMFVHRFAKFLSAHQQKIEKLQQELNSLTSKAVDIDTPISKVIRMLKEVKADPSDGEVAAKLDEAVRILTRGALYMPVFASKGSKALDQGLSQWVKETLELKKEEAPINAAAIKGGDGPSIDRVMRLLQPKNPNFSMEALMHKVDSWDFDVFEVDESTGKRPLTFVAFALFLKYKFFTLFGVEEECLLRFLNIIEGGYRGENPYHNAIHATDVTQTFHALITLGGLRAKLTDLELFAAIVSCIVHDFAHPGVNNNFLIKSRHPLALEYNDRGVLENMHCSRSFTLMFSEETNILRGLTREQADQFRKVSIEMILATDMSRHFEILGRFRNKLAAGPDSINIADPVDKSLVLEMAIKCADVSNPAKKWNIAVEWSKRVTQEFYLQGDSENEMKLGISMFMDRNKSHEFTKSQVGFIDLFVAPLYDEFTSYLTALKPYREYISANRTGWENAVDITPF